MFAGGHVDCRHAALLAVRGLSGTSTPAQNLRGINVAVAARASQISIVFPTSEPDGVYAVQVMPAWLTACAVSAKTQQGFTLQFGTPSNVATSLDWVLVR